MDLREAKDSDGGSVLYFAAAEGHLEVCRFLVEESRLDVNCPNADGELLSESWAVGHRSGHSGLLVPSVGSCQITVDMVAL
jgi:hypothetical protein